MKMSVKLRMVLLVAVLMLTIIGIGGYSRWALDQVNDQLTVLSKTQLPCIDLANSIDTLASDFRIEEHSHILAQTPEDMVTAEKNMESINNKIQQQFSEYEKLIENDTERGIFNTAKTDWETYIEINKNEIIPLSKQFRTEEAILQTQGQSQKVFDEAAIYLQKLVDYNRERANKTNAEADALYAQTITFMVTIIVVVVIVGAIIAFVIVSSILKPINTLKEQFDSLAQRGGDLTQQIKINSKDELGDLAYSINKFIDNLRLIMTEVNKRSDEVLETSQQLTSASQQTAASANETSATMGEIATTVESVTFNVEEISASSQGVNQQANEGEQGILMVIDHMGKIVDATQGVSVAIKELSDKSHEINQIVGLITNIADQTNLLALNAAIEAARAGEHGRGFAVVAEEVRKLAEQSSKATGEISNLINAIQLDSLHAVDAVTEGRNTVDAGMQVVEQVGDKFKVIIGSIHGLTEQIQQIASATEQMSAGVQNVAASTEEETAAMEEVSASAESLSKLANDLKGLIGKFKI